MDNPNGLVLTKDREFAGFIGSSTGLYTTLEEPIKIGDTVRVQEETNKHRECVGEVAVFGNRIAVMGLAGTPLGELTIIEVVVDSMDLKEGDLTKHGFRVERWLGASK